MAESHKRRLRVLQELEDHLEFPMLVLAAIWIALIIFEATTGLPPVLQTVGLIIWVIFIAEYAIRFTLAPSKPRFLKHNWLGLVALVIPAFRVFRIFQAIRILQVSEVSQSISLVRIVAAANRSMGALGRTLGRRGFGYVTAVTMVIAFLGAAGMYKYEAHVFKDYWDALWWSVMVIATIGSDYWPKSNEGRILTVLMAVYGFSILGYLAATLASFFVDQDVKHTKDDVSLKKVYDEVVALRKELEAMRTGQPVSMKDRASLQ